ncbi:N-6 DNA methylase [Candidatus Micrarchaeota archaeon]|nr:N-6 DNA methylase [Candidatus Micrarchaeota archaeon]MBU1166485.1 N-6 DNA methylase [Candidatus Micrarchaeota archaeon]MBU1887143.1 N-6 DNA methylase [Candidatus Micrarchaeota archaeon]
MTKTILTPKPIVQPNTIITIPDGYISDYIDGKFRKDTPEEYVRQNIEKRLINEHKYTPDQIAVEFKIKQGSKSKRVDLAIFPDDADKKQENIQIIIECKRENVAPSSRNEGVEQLKSYMSASLNCEWGMWTNGKSKFVYRKVKDIKGKHGFEEPNDIPSKGRDLSEIDRPTRDSLKLATEDNLLFAFRTCHDHIFVNDGMQKQPAFFELLKVIFCKIVDERNIPHPLEFYASSGEKSSQDGRLTVKNRINKIFEKVKSRYPNIFDKNDEIKLKPISLAYIVSELQKYSFLDTVIDVKGKAYEEIVGSNLRGDRGEFFTPRNVQHMLIQMLDIRLDEKVLDPACGTGGFLVISMNNVIKRLKEEMVRTTHKKEQEWSDSLKEQLRDSIREKAAQNFFGFDINPDLVKATKMNMVMNNDGSGNILQNDSLQQPHEMSDEIKTGLCKIFDLEKGKIRRPSDLALFNVVVTNPPFGTKLPIKDQNVLEQFDLGHVWKQDETSGHYYQTEKICTSRAPEVLFIERCYQFLTPGGRLGIVLPNALLGAPGLEYACIREWILQKFNLIASIQLHPDTFQPHNGTQTSILVLQKKTEKEIQSGTRSNYRVFFAIADKVGHDKRGNDIYKRDKEGNEILIPEENGSELNGNSKETPIRQLPKKRVRDDQTPVIAEIFLDWKKKEGLRW